MIKRTLTGNRFDQRRCGAFQLFKWFLVLLITFLLSCGEVRLLRTHEDAINHFHRYQSDFEKAAALYLAIGKPEFAPLTLGSSKMSAEEVELTRIAKKLFITDIYIVPRSGPPDEQYIEFVLEGKTLQPYGVIYVPPDHKGAMITCRNCLGEGPEVYSVFRDLGRQWFYFEYR